jgi:hypothetical protein
MAIGTQNSLFKPILSQIENFSNLFVLFANCPAFFVTFSTAFQLEIPCVKVFVMKKEMGNFLI